MTIGELKKNTELSRLEFELITAHVLKKTREFVLIHAEQKLTSAQLKRITELEMQRLQGRPLAYLLGEKEFCGLNFSVNEHTLIPRPETELMAEEVLQDIKSKKDNLEIIDLGTGSGCIAIAIAHKSRRKVLALDISAEAIKVAKKNAKLNEVFSLVTFKQGNLLEPYLESKVPSQKSNLIIMANLPYLTAAQVRQSPSIQHEPKSALISGTDGLKHYRELFQQLKKYRITDSIVYCEIDDTQGKTMPDLIKKSLPLAQFIIKQDLSGYDRLAIIRI